MESSTNLNNFIGSLPRIRKRRVWSVTIDGVIVQYVSATDNRKSSAEAYIAGKYPGKVFTLQFSRWKMGV